jgi:hypothetical protein
MMVAVIMEYANIVELNVYKTVKEIGLKFRRYQNENGRL